MALNMDMCIECNHTMTSHIHVASWLMCEQCSCALLVDSSSLQRKEYVIDRQFIEQFEQVIADGEFDITWKIETLKDTEGDT